MDLRSSSVTAEDEITERGTAILKGTRTISKGFDGCHKMFSRQMGNSRQPQVRELIWAPFVDWEPHTLDFACI